MLYQIHNTDFLERHTAEEDIHTLTPLMYDGKETLKVHVGYDDPKIPDTFKLGETFSQELKLSSILISKEEEEEMGVPDNFCHANAWSELVSYREDLYECTDKVYEKKYKDGEVRTKISIVGFNPEGVNKNPETDGMYDHLLRSNKRKVYIRRLSEPKGEGWKPVVVECTIPKGSEYYLSENGEYLSSSLKFDRIHCDSLPTYEGFEKIEEQFKKIEDILKRMKSREQVLNKVFYLEKTDKWN